MYRFGSVRLLCAPHRKRTVRARDSPARMNELELPTRPKELMPLAFTRRPPWAADLSCSALLHHAMPCPCVRKARRQGWQPKGRDPVDPGAERCLQTGACSARTLDDQPRVVASGRFRGAHARSIRGREGLPSLGISASWTNKAKRPDKDGPIGCSDAIRLLYGSAIAESGEDHARKRASRPNLRI